MQRRLPRTGAAISRPIGGVAIALLAATLMACGSSAAPMSASRPARSDARVVPTVLVLTQTLGYHHASIPTAAAAVREFAARSGGYRVAFLSSAAALTPSRLRHARAVVFLLTSGELPMNAVEKRALVAFVRGGGGLIGFHSASDTFHHWPAFKEMIGAEFSHHPRPSTERVIVTDHATPASRTLPDSFRVHEEFYVFTRDPRPHVHVLAQLATGPHGPDRPLVWCRRFGRGRVLYDALGHFDASWHNPDERVLAAGGILWAAGLQRAPSCGRSDK